MKRWYTNKKGFTLIELLAVIIILGVLLTIAIPKVSQYINNSKKSGFIDTANAMVSSVKNDIISEQLPAPISNNDVLIVTIDKINLDNLKNNKSSFGGKILSNLSYVAVVNIGTGTNPEYAYFVSMQDAKNYAIPLTDVGDLDEDLVVANAKKKMEVTIQALCGTPEGKKMALSEIKGLNSVQPIDSNGNKISWDVTIYSTSGCGQSE